MVIDEKELQKEKENLEKVENVIKQKISSLGQELYDKEEKIQEFQKFMWDARHDMDPSEMKSMVAVNDIEVNMALRKGSYFQKLFKIQNNPYFGAITFDDLESCQKIYIGITHLENGDDYLIHDWRAPVCSMFYDYEVGPSQYESPSGVIHGELRNKRQFKIENGELIRLFDNSLNIDDDVLQEVLANTANEKMKNIVNTIQQEQNAIIRNVSDKTLIVQGIAGSGKTSVALHRIAFLLYKIENLSSKNILIFSPNQVFSEYISNVLPELGEENTMQTTFHDFLSSFIKEYKSVESFTSFVERFYKYKETNKELVIYKQSDEVINHLNNYINDLYSNLKFTDGIECHEFSIDVDELNYLLNDRYSKFNLYDRIDAISNKICSDFYKGKHTKKKSIRSALFKLLNFKLDYKNIYLDFFKSRFFYENYNGKFNELEHNFNLSQKEIRYEDACLLVYIKSLLEGFEYRGLIKEVVIDEAQDYSRLQYIIIKNIFKKSGFTILGDINQTINPYYKYESLETLKDLFDDSTYIELNKTYRSSEEIINYTNKILGLSHVSAIRNSNKRNVIEREEIGDLHSLIVKDINDLMNSGFSVAIITKNDEESEYIYKLIKKDYDYVSILKSNTTSFDKRLVITPAYISKGLEFDSTIIYTFPNNRYTETEKNLFYVACTRSQHQLIVYNR